MMVAANSSPGWGLLAAAAALALNLGLAKITGRTACVTVDRGAAAQRRHPELARPVVEAGIRVPSGDRTS